MFAFLALLFKIKVDFIRCFLARSPQTLCRACQCRTELSPQTRPIQLGGFRTSGFPEEHLDCSRGRPAFGDLGKQFQDQTLRKPVVLRSFVRPSARISTLYIFHDREIVRLASCNSRDFCADRCLLVLGYPNCTLTKEWPNGETAVSCM
jgi:hypothetical protein